MAKSAFSVLIDDKALKELSKQLKKEINQAITSKVAKEVGSTVVKEMKRMIAAGLSPIREKGRFEGYRGGYLDAIRKGRLRGKRERPVNLKLSGDFLKSLTSSVRLNGGTVIYFNSAKSRKKEQGHREEHNNQAKRPIIPQGSEEFAVSIMRKIEKIYTQRIIDVLNRL